MKQNRKTTSATRIACMAMSLACLATTSNAATILSTDFTGITIDGTDPNQANGISWTGTALSAPSSLTLENVVTVQNDGQLMDQNAVSAANGFFGGNTNLSSGNPSTGQWGVTIQVTVGGSAISLENIGLNVAHATNSGSHQQNNRDTMVTVNVIDTSDSSVVGTASQTFNVIGNLLGSSLDDQVTFASALSLAASGVYDVEFLVNSPNNNAGHYAAFGSMEFNGSVIPEPSSALLGGLGLLFLLRRRR